ncbi:MAG: isoprenyl transferase [Chloroflexaceae bacterium]|nr:isoprenyl transferase [Chloroflexaceae bacterium]
MADSTSNEQHIPRHVAIIMDGNGRWANRRGLPRLAGHRAGTENVRRVLRTCSDIGIDYVTLYAFSTENWQRPSSEVEGLMRILSDFLDRETQALHQEGIRLHHLGRLEGISDLLIEKVRYALELTRNNGGMTLSIAFNYGGRHDIVEAVRRMIAEGFSADRIDEATMSAHLSTAGIPDPDLIIRTSGEWRLSNFLIWESAYSEYWSTPTLWPDFGPEQLHQAIHEYSQRERRFGTVR